MRPSLLLLLLTCLAFCSDVFSENSHLSFYSCSKFPQWEVMVSSGAVVTSNGSLGTNIAKNQCSLTLKTLPSSKFLVQLMEFSFTSNDICREHLTIVDVQSGERLLDAACNLTSQLPTRWQTEGSQLQAIFVRNSSILANERPSSFKLIITSIKPRCKVGDSFKCSGFCITPSLLCDNVPHCPKAEDEQSCQPSASAPPYPSSGTPSSDHPQAVTGPSTEKEDSLYLWLPLIVVVAFTIIMLSLIMIGRRATNCGTSATGYSTANNVVKGPGRLNDSATVAMITESVNNQVTTTEPPIESENIDEITIALVAVVFVVVLVACLILGFREKRHRNNELQINDDLRVEINSNPGFTDGAPATPPPTYSMIERQTSYVSNISQTSSQLSIPPDYNDVVDTDDIMAPNRRRRINSARSNSSSSWRNRPRHFQRSLSAQDSYTGRNRFPSDRSDSAGIYHGRPGSATEGDNVFIDSPPAVRTSSTAQSPLGNLSEVDETLGNSTILTEVVEINANPDASQNCGTPNGSQEMPEVTIAQTRPVLQRSISDITDSNAVRFSLGD